MSESFVGKAVIVTGAARGLGRGIAEEFAAAGANVMIGARTMSYAGEALSAMGVLDNLSSHKKPAVRAAIRARGARLLFLPPFCPDLNPIEQVFAKLEHFLRKSAERTQDATWRRIGSLLECFEPDECANCLRNSNYGPTECHLA